MHCILPYTGMLTTISEHICVKKLTRDNNNEFLSFLFAGLLRFFSDYTHF
jgi:hypothetical protein